MKKFLLGSIAISSLILFGYCSESIDTTNIQQDIKKTDATKTFLTKCDFVINKQIYKICYNKTAKGALGVKYTLDGSLVNKVNIKKRPRFYSEKTIPVQYRTKYADYTYATDSTNLDRSFDRGHLAPDASFDWDKKILRKVYTMANIIPQVSVVNRKTWIKSEAYERLVVSKTGEANITLGVLYGDLNRYLVKKPLDKISGSDKWSLSKKQSYLKKATALKEKHILIPTAFYRIVESGDLKRCFLYENVEVDPKKDKLKNHLVDCNTLPQFDY